jgi:hypothetical protein
MGPWRHGIFELLSCLTRAARFLLPRPRAGEGEESGMWEGASWEGADGREEARLQDMAQAAARAHKFAY